MKDIENQLSNYLSEKVEDTPINWKKANEVILFFNLK